MRGHRTGLHLVSRASAPAESAESFWMALPRTGFSQYCVQRFGFGFDEGYVANWTPPQVPVGVPIARAYPTVTEAVELQKGRRHAGRRWNTDIANRAMRKSDRLVG
jgi:hypothetical protein